MNYAETQCEVCGTTPCVCNPQRVMETHEIPIHEPDCKCEPCRTDA